MLRINVNTGIFFTWGIRKLYTPINNIHNKNENYSVDYLRTKDTFTLAFTMKTNLAMTCQFCVCAIVHVAKTHHRETESCHMSAVVFDVNTFSWSAQFNNRLSRMGWHLLIH